MPKVVANPGSRLLVIGGWLSAGAAVLHLAVIAGGPEWYRFFGAGEAMARAAQRGEWMPALVTLAIAAILAIWAAYAFAGAGRIARWPLLRTALVAISGVYLARGLIVVPLLIWGRGQVNAFGVWSSLIVLAYGLAYAVGTWRAWPFLRRQPT